MKDLSRLEARWLEPFASWHIRGCFLPDNVHILGNVMFRIVYALHTLEISNVEVVETWKYIMNYLLYL